MHGRARLRCVAVRRQACRPEQAPLLSSSAHDDLRSRSREGRAQPGKRTIVAVSLEIARQHVAAENASAPVGSAAVSERQGSYRSESVKPTPDNSVLSKAAAEGAGVVTPPRTNLQDLARRVQEGPAVTTASLYETLGEMPEL